MKLNTVTQILMALGIIRNLLSGITNIPSAMIGSYAGIVNVIFSILAVVCLALMLNLKKDGYYGFIAVTVLNTLVVANYDGDWGAHITAGVITIALLSGVLFLKKDGHNGYEALGIAKGK